MRSVVFAYQDVGFVCLRELLRAGADVAAVITHDDDPNEAIWFRSVRQLATEHGLPVFAPLNVNTPEWIERIRACAPDFLFSFYYRKLLGAELLRLPKRGALNLHGSLLPKYRGRCPVNWVIIHGEIETGVTLHYMEEKPDRGDIVAQRAVAIDAADTAHTLYAKLTDAAAELMRETYPLLCRGQAHRLPQDHSQASYFGGRRPDDGRIDWKQSATQVSNLVRAVTHPYPGAFTLWRGRKLFMWEAAIVPLATTGVATGCVAALTPAVRVQCGDGLLEMRRAQLEGEDEMPGSEWARRHALQQGEQFE